MVLSPSLQISKAIPVDNLSYNEAKWLTTDEADRYTTGAIRQLDNGVTALQLATTLSRDSTLSLAQRHAVLHVATVRRKARARYPSADLMLFTKDALEQLSDPQVARWRATELLRRFVAVHGNKPTRIVDLCAGVGGDTEYLAELGVPVVCVEQDPVRALFLQHNLAVRAVNASVHVGDALTFPTHPNDAVFCDPARRADGKRIRHIGAYLPSVPSVLAAHHQAGVVAIAVAPGVDATDPALPPHVEASYIDVAGQLTEAVLWAEASKPSARRTTAVILPEALTLQTDERRERQPVKHEIAGWLLVMRPAAIRARVHDEIAKPLGGYRIAQTRAMFHTMSQPPTSPWYRERRIAAVSHAAPKQVRATLRKLPERPVEIVLHGVDTDPDRLWRQLGSPRRGPQGWRLEFIRRDDDSVVVITDAES